MRQENREEVAMSDPQPGRETHHVAVTRCYKDAIRYQAHHFLGRPRLAGDGQDVRLGRVVFVVQKTLSENRDPYHAPAFTDEAATVLPVGTPVYEVAGYSTDRRLAAYRNDTLHIYDRDEK
jgi:hypothetical protein